MPSSLSTPIRKKQRTEHGPAPSLIGLIPSREANNDFSQFGPKGSTIFPTSAQEPIWRPPKEASSSNCGALSVVLNKFGQNQLINNTLAIKFSTPSDSKRFSFNIAPPNHDNFRTILFHFNPRKYENGGKIVLNDKRNEMWGKAIDIPLSQFPLMFGRQEACTIIMQLEGTDFNIYVEGQHCAHFNLRQKIELSWDNLTLQFPSTDDYGNSESWEVQKVWWGHQAPITSRRIGASEIVPGVRQDESLHPCKLFVRGLEKVSTGTDIERRRAGLERDFSKYGGQHGVKVWVPKNRGFAFVEAETKEKADLALKEMASLFCLSRARR